MDYKGGRKLRLRKAFKREVWNIQIIQLNIHFCSAILNLGMFAPILASQLVSY